MYPVGVLGCFNHHHSFVRVHDRLQPRHALLMLQELVQARIEGRGGGGGGGGHGFGLRTLQLAHNTFDIQELCGRQPSAWESHSLLHNPASDSETSSLTVPAACTTSESTAAAATAPAASSEAHATRRFYDRECAVLPSTSRRAVTVVFVSGHPVLGCEREFVCALSPFCDSCGRRGACSLSLLQWSGGE